MPQKSPDDLTQQIKATESVLSLSLNEYKLLTIDRMHHQHTVIKNYLWLSASFVAAEAAMFSQMFPQAAGAVLGILFAATAISVFAMFVGIRSMTGASFSYAIPTGNDILNYVCPQGNYDSNLHLSLLRDMVGCVEEGIEEAFKTFKTRSKTMKLMNGLLSAALLMLGTSGGLFFIQLTS